MRIPAIRGAIDRRVLVNYRIDAAVVAKLLPKPFEPQIVDGFAIGGVCLIRLKSLRPSRLPVPWGFGSENAAYRFAVEWDEAGERRRGVYIPRRDTSSRIVAFTGGRVFPGVHHLADFEVTETDSDFSIRIRSRDRSTEMGVEGSVAEGWPSGSLFPTLEAASGFFREGSLGYSATHTGNRFDGLELRCTDWRVEPFAAQTVESSYFEDTSIFPPGSIEYDGALLMRGIDHEWHSREDLCR